VAGISKIKELEERKRALVAECETSRQALKEEVWKLRQQGLAFRHKVERVRSVGPWVMLASTFAVPVLRPLFGLGKRVKAPRPSALKKGFATGLMAFRSYQKYSPLVRSLVAQFRNKRRRAAGARTMAANN
jgi:hypothetical protein